MTHEDPPADYRRLGDRVILVALSWIHVVPWWVGSVGAGITAVAVIVSWRRQKNRKGH